MKWNLSFSFQKLVSKKLSKIYFQEFDSVNSLQKIRQEPDFFTVQTWENAEQEYFCFNFSPGYFKQDKQKA